MGTHWTMADPSIAVVRRMRNKARQSERHKRLKYGWQNTNVTEEWIRKECLRHLDDPIIQELVPVEEKTVAEIKTLLNKSFIQEALIVELRNQIKEKDNQIEQLKYQLFLKDIS
jgi:hypothetical protein